MNPGHVRAREKDRMPTATQRPPPCMLACEVRPTAGQGSGGQARKMHPARLAYVDVALAPAVLACANHNDDLRCLCVLKNTRLGVARMVLFFWLLLPAAVDIHVL